MSKICKSAFQAKNVIRVDIHCLGHILFGQLKVDILTVRTFNGKENQTMNIYFHCFKIAFSNLEYLFSFAVYL